MPLLETWSPSVYSPSDGPVVSNSRGLMLTQSLVNTLYGGNDAEAIQAAIEDLSNGKFTPASRPELYFSPPSSGGTPVACVDDPEHPFAPCQPDASDFELNYVKVPVIYLKQGDTASPFEQKWSGTVTVHRTVNLDRPIRARRDCTLDFLNNVVNMIDDQTFISMGQGVDYCQFSCVKNVRVKAHPQQTQPILRMNVLPGYRWYNLSGVKADQMNLGIMEYNSFENIQIIGHINGDACFDGIHFYSAGGHLVDLDDVAMDKEGLLWWGGASQWNTFRNVHMSRVRRGIFIEQSTWNGSYNNGNVFTNIHVRDFRRLIEFKVPLFCERTSEAIGIYKSRQEEDDWQFSGIQPCHFNVFSHLTGTTTQSNLADGGVVNVYGSGNRFDHVGLPTWSSVNGPQYTAASKKKGSTDPIARSYLCAYTIQQETNPALSTLDRFVVDSPSEFATVGARIPEMPSVCDE